MELPNQRNIFKNGVLRIEEWSSINNSNSRTFPAQRTDTGV